MNDSARSSLKQRERHFRLDLLSPSGHAETHVLRFESGIEYSVRRSGVDLSVKTSPVATGFDLEVQTAGTLRDHLNRSVNQWGEVVKVSNQEIDCLIQSKRKQPPLKLQVVRADIDQDRWSFLATVPTDKFCFEDDVTVDIAAARLMQAIRKKESHYPTATKGGLILVLDATYVPETFDSKVRDRIRSTTSSTDFRAIWVVGPTVDDVWRLI